MNMCYLITDTDKLTALLTSYPQYCQKQSLQIDKYIKAPSFNKSKINLVVQFSLPLDHSAGSLFRGIVSQTVLKVQLGLAPLGQEEADEEEEDRG